MSGVTIYTEGGGNARSTRDALRQGMDEFLRDLKDKVRKKSWRWKLVCCGGRNRAFTAFMAECNRGVPGIVVLLVDSEGPVRASPQAHLAAMDRWDLSGVDPDCVHLMVQVMETWIVADPQALDDYYGQGFRANALPADPNLEEVDKATVVDSLRRATERTQKDRHHKIRHAADLLARIDPAKARRRCNHCERLFDALGAYVAAG